MYNYIVFITYGLVLVSTGQEGYETQSVGRVKDHKKIYGNRNTYAYAA